MTASPRLQADGRPPMEKVAAAFETKSDKIRALSKAGYSRTEIANFIGVRYQFVRNVLVNDERAGKGAPSIQPSVSEADARLPADRAAAEVMPVRVFVDAKGEVTIPASHLRGLGLKTGDPVVLVVEQGEIRAMPIAAAVKRAQAIVRRYVPEDVSLVDELIAERRAEARREDEGD